MVHVDTLNLRHYAKAVQLLIEKGADVNAQGRSHKNVIQAGLMRMPAELILPSGLPGAENYIRSRKNIDIYGPYENASRIYSTFWVARCREIYNKPEEYRHLLLKAGLMRMPAELILPSGLPGAENYITSRKKIDINDPVILWLSGHSTSRRAETSWPI